MTLYQRFIVAIYSFYFGKFKRFNNCIPPTV